MAGANLLEHCWSFLRRFHKDRGGSRLIMDTFPLAGQLNACLVM